MIESLLTALIENKDLRNENQRLKTKVRDLKEDNRLLQEESQPNNQVLSKKMISNNFEKYCRNHNIPLVIY